MKKVPSILESIQKLIDNHKKVTYAVQAYMWEELKFFVKYTRIFSDMLVMRTQGLQKEARELFENKLKPLITAHESYDQGALDVSRLINTINTALSDK